MMRDGGLDREVLTLLDLHDRVDQRTEDKARAKWRHGSSIASARAPRDVTIAVTGKYTALRDAYASIIKAIEHCGVHLGVNVHLKWLDTTDAGERARRQAPAATCHGIIVPGGFGVRGTEGKIDCIRYARENKVPYLGLCLGFQMAVIEYARNVCGIADANSSEFDPQRKTPVIDILPEQKKIEGLGGNMRLGGKDVDLKPGTLASQAVRQRHAHPPALPPSLRGRSEVHLHARRARPGLQRQAPEPADHADPRAAAGRAPVLHRHAGAPRADQPPAAPQPAVHGPDPRGDGVCGTAEPAAGAGGLNVRVTPPPPPAR